MAHRTHRRGGQPTSHVHALQAVLDDVEREGGQTIADLLPTIREQADVYEAWTLAAADKDRQLNRIELAVYRMGAAESELLKPILIWLHDPTHAVPTEVAADVTAVVESWHVRWQMLRLSVGDMGRIVAEIIRLYTGTPVAELRASVERHLTGLNVASTYWPGNDEIRSQLVHEQAYRRFTRARLRMLLEAIEDAHRRHTNQPQVSRRGYPIEHVMPQSWAQFWPVAGLEAQEARAEHVHRLGNLTLLTTSLNSKVSNSAWVDKRSALEKHDTLLLNSRLLAAGDRWDEPTIESRTRAMIDVLLATWPVPEGHEGTVVDPHAKTGGWVEVKHLVEAGLLPVGTVLRARSGIWETSTATVLADGQLEVHGQAFGTPSGAGRQVKGTQTNGWTFWSLPDGRRLSDVRAQYDGIASTPGVTVDWSELHRIVESLAVDAWTTSDSLADAVGTASQTLAAHVDRCPTCAHLQRVTVGHGALGFVVRNDEDFALPGSEPPTSSNLDPARELSGDDLQALSQQ